MLFSLDNSPPQSTHIHSWQLSRKLGLSLLYSTPRRRRIYLKISKSKFFFTFFLLQWKQIWHKKVQNSIICIRPAWDVPSFVTCHIWPILFNPLMFDQTSQQWSNFSHPYRSDGNFLTYLYLLKLTTSSPPSGTICLLSRRGPKSSQRCLRSQPFREFLVWREGVEKSKKNRDGNVETWTGPSLVHFYLFLYWRTDWLEGEKDTNPNIWIRAYVNIMLLPRFNPLSTHSLTGLSYFTGHCSDINAAPDSNPNHLILLISLTLLLFLGHLWVICIHTSNKSPYKHCWMNWITVRNNNKYDAMLRLFC